MFSYFRKSLLLKVCYYSVMAYFSYLMVLITIQYIPVDFEVAFLKIKPDEIQLKHYQIAFFAHVYSSIVVHLAGITQFSAYIRKRFTKLHRFLGLTYVFGVLLFASPSGLVMGYYANGEIVAQFSFSVLAILWFFFTCQAFISAVKKDWVKHQNYMLRSYALTLSAISLRLLKWGISNTFELPPMDTYQIVSIAGWIFNLLIIELYIRLTMRQKAH